MSRVKYAIFVVLACYTCLLAAQLDVAKDQDKLVLDIQSRLNQAQIDLDRNDYYNATNSLNSALEIAQQIEDKSSEGLIYTKLAKVQYFLDEPDKANNSLTKAIQIQRELDDYPNLATTYNIKGMLHLYKDEYTSALEYFKASKNLYTEENLESYISEVNLNEAMAYIAMEAYTKAKDVLEKTIILARKYDQHRILSSALIENGKVYAATDELDLALNPILEGLDIAQTHHIIENINRAYLTLSKIYDKKNDYANAYLYIQKHLKLADSLLNIQGSNLSSRQSAQYVNEYLDAENTKLKAMVDEVNAESNFTRITTILSIALITILSLLTLSLYKNNNIRLKTNNMLHKKNDELIVAKEKAELATKTKSNFLSTVTHELRTPLYAVTGLTTMLLDEDPRDDQVPHLKSLKFSGDYLLTFINDILQINKIEANKVELDPEVFNLKHKVENVVSALGNSAQANQTKIQVEYDKALPETFYGDQLKLSQILINLVGNAIKFTKDGDIWVRVTQIDFKDKIYKLRFEIEDSGIGITKEKQDKLFESFSQGSVQINRKYGGTGLGLSIVKGLVSILKGKIYLKSELGKGSTFYVEVPLEQAATQETIVEDVKTNEPNKFNDLDLSEIKILIVEDNKINQMITKKILNKMGLECDVVDNGEDAVDIVKTTAYNVVLMDIHMPGISGLEATKIIRTFNRDLTIFALTAVTLEDKMPEFDEAGFNDIISKPFKQEDFEAKLYEAITSKQKVNAS